MTQKHTDTHNDTHVQTHNYSLTYKVTNNEKMTYIMIHTYHTYDSKFTQD